MSDPTDAPAITEHEWLDRYELAFILRGVPQHVAQQARVAETFATLSNGFRDDPEGAADMEMSYWSE